jgi:hypothetical protein
MKNYTADVRGQVIDTPVVMAYEDGMQHAMEATVQDRRMEHIVVMPTFALDSAASE